MLPLTLALVFHQAKLIDESFAAVPLPKALERLSKDVGQTLTCARVFEDEPLIARLKGADSERVLREIATTFDAKWVPVANGLRLERDLILRQKNEAAERKEENEALEKGFADIAARRAKQPSQYSKADVLRIEQSEKANAKARADAEHRKADYGDEGINGEVRPSWRAFARLIALIGTPALRSFQPGQRVVWSENPTSVQVPLPGNAKPILANYRKELELFGAPPGAIGQVRLAIQRDSGSFNFSLRVFDIRGVQCDGADEEIDLRGGSEDAREPTKVTAKNGEAPLVISPSVAEYLTLMNLRKPAVRDATFERWQPRFADPAAEEPLSYGPGPILVSLAESRDQNLIGTIDDWTAATCRTQLSVESLSSSRILSAVGGFLSVRDGWLICRSPSPAVRLPRKESGALMAYAVEKGGLPIDDAAAWIARHPDCQSEFSWLSEHLDALLFNQSAFELDTFPEDQSLYLLWNALGFGARSALRNGSSIALPDLPAEAQRLLFRKIFWENIFQNTGWNSSIDDADLDDLTPTLLSRLRNGDSEITEILADGLVGGSLSLEISEEPEFVAWNSKLGEPVNRIPFSLEGFAHRTVNDEKRNVDRGYDRYRICQHRTYRLIVEFKRPGLRYEGMLPERSFDPKAEPLKKLPDLYLRAIEDAKQRILATPEKAPPVQITPPN